ncbi:MAG: hypothetical protein ACREMQ_08965 [Longimicrobiales bacterium]
MRGLLVLVLLLSACADPGVETSEPVAAARVRRMLAQRAEARELAKLHNQFQRYANGATGELLRERCRLFYGGHSLSTAGCEINLASRRVSSVSSSANAASSPEQLDYYMGLLDVLIASMPTDAQLASGIAALENAVLADGEITELESNDFFLATATAPESLGHWDSDPAWVPFYDENPVVNEGRFLNFLRCVRDRTNADFWYIIGVDVGFALGGPGASGFASGYAAGVSAGGCLD